MSSPSPSIQSPRPLSIRLSTAALIALAAVVYLPSLGGRFIWDDDPFLLKNPLMEGFRGFIWIWTRSGMVRGEPHWYPVTYSVLWLEHALWGWRPMGFRAVNLLIHIAIVLQIRRLLLRLEASPAAAWLGAALFAVHPVHAETVAWIIDIKDLLATWFYLLALECFLNSTEAPRKGWLPLGALAAVLMMLSKSTYVTLPAGLAIVLWYKKARSGARSGENSGGRFGEREWRAIVVACYSVLPPAILDWSLAHGRETEYGGGVTLLERILGSGHALVFYAKKLAWPAGLAPIYPPWPLSERDWAVWAPCVAIAAVFAAAWFARGKIGRAPFACLFFFAATLSPSLGLIRFNFLSLSPAADRYQYLASLGLLAGAGALLAMIRMPRVRIAFSATWILIFATLAIRQARAYGDEVVWFGRVVAVDPDCAFAWDHLGQMMLDAGRLREATIFLEKEMQLDPGNPIGNANLAAAFVLLGEDKPAVDYYEKAIANDDGEMIEFYSYLAWTLACSPDPAVRDPQRALAMAEKGVSLSKLESPIALEYLATAQAAKGHPEVAAKTARRALDLAKRQELPDRVGSIERELKVYEAGKAYIRAPGPDGEYE